mmetsp:Transcript_3159/g.7668  ORF Transcript_3159/g.7668 Transcript_3159/m.7668 type:complete len:224 (+) Transcript_3159:1-672(+)
MPPPRGSKDGGKGQWRDTMDFNGFLELIREIQVELKDPRAVFDQLDQDFDDVISIGDIVSACSASGPKKGGGARRRNPSEQIAAAKQTVRADMGPMRRQAAMLRQQIRAGLEVTDKMERDLLRVEEEDKKHRAAAGVAPDESELREASKADLHDPKEFIKCVPLVQELAQKLDLAQNPYTRVRDLKQYMWKCSSLVHSHEPLLSEVKKVSELLVPITQKAHDV